MGKLWDIILRQKPEPYIGPPRTYVITLNRQRFDVYCRNTGINTRDPNVIVLSTHDAASGNTSLGYRLRPQDKVIVLEDADFGHDWQAIVKNILIASEGWVDLRERQEVRT